MAGHVRDPLLGQRALGDVLVGGEPADAGNRLVDEADDAAVDELDHVVRGLALGDHGEQVAHILVAVPREAARGAAMLEELPQRCSGLHDTGRQSVHLGIAVVAERQPGRRIEHQHAMRHVVEDGVEQRRLGADRAARGGAQDELLGANVGSRQLRSRQGRARQFLGGKILRGQFVGRKHGRCGASARCNHRSVSTNAREQKARPNAPSHCPPAAPFERETCVKLFNRLRTVLFKPGRWRGAGPQPAPDRYRWYARPIR